MVSMLISVSSGKNDRTLWPSSSRWPKMRFAVDAGRSRGLARLYLETWGKMATAVRLYESSGWVRGEDPPASSGADRSYWLVLGRLPPRSNRRPPRAGQRERWAAE